MPTSFDLELCARPPWYFYFLYCIPDYIIYLFLFYERCPKKHTILPDYKKILKMKLVVGQMQFYQVLI